MDSEAILITAKSCDLCEGGWYPAADKQQHKHLPCADIQTASSTAVRKLSFSHETRDDIMTPEPNTAPAFPTGHFSSPRRAALRSSPRPPPPAKPTCVTRFIRPSSEAIARMNQEGSDAGGKALRAKAYWERRFAPLKCLEEASLLARNSMREASIVFKQGASSNLPSATVALPQTAMAPPHALAEHSNDKQGSGTTQLPSEMAVCEDAGQGPRDEGEEGDVHVPGALESSASPPHGHSYPPPPDAAG